MNEIMVRTDKTFQAKELNDAVKGLSKAFQNIDKNRKDACLIMWRLEDGKKYEKDGFKSLFDFAETIGIDKSTAHKMADAGRVYDSKVPEIAQFADKAGYTVAANVASMLKDEGQAKKLEEAIKDKSLNENMTVDKVKTWKADAIAQNKPTKVLQKVEVWGTYGNGNSFHYDAIELENVEELTDDFIKVGTVDLSTSDTPEKWTVYINRLSLEMLRIHTEKVKKEAKPAKKPAKKSLDDMTPEEFQAWAAERGMTITFTNVTEK